MIFNEWNVLLVDDEPDVLSISRLALRDVKVYGLPLNLYTATSKAEAIELLHNEFAIEGVAEGSLAVAFIDVVMENEHAGLELCRYIREDMQQTSAQLYIRTGQPGVIPERQVIDDYDISGYFTKVEATEQKLYTFVKSGIRQWYSVYYANLIADFTNYLIAHATTKKDLLAAIDPAGEGFESDGNVTGMIFDEDTISSFDPASSVLALRDELDDKEPIFVTPEGHKMIVDGKRIMVAIRETEDTAQYCYVAESHMEMPPALLQITFRNGLALSTLWKRAK